MKYYNFLEIPNWKKLQELLIKHKKKNLFSNLQDLYDDPHKKWKCYFETDVINDLPEVYDTFEKLGLHIRQLIYFTNLQNDLDVKDSSDPRCVFIHTDSKDNLEARYETKIPLLTDFHPTDAINIPLENYKDSLTLFYKILNDNGDVYYPVYCCGGHDHKDVVEVERFELTRPAVLKINVPHAVYNPNVQPRSVATFRFYEDLTYLY